MWQGCKVTTQAEYFQQHQVDGVIPDALMGDFLSLPEGDTLSLIGEGTSATPGADSTKATTATDPVDPPKDGAPVTDPAAATPPPVILAKDGIHTIPYEKLEQERRDRQAAEAEAARLAAENEALKAAASAPAAAQAPAAPDPTTAVDPAAEVDFGDYSDEAMRRGVSALVAKAVAPLQAELETLRGTKAAEEQVSAAEAHWTQIYGAHPDLDSIVESAELAAWIGQQPTFLQGAYRATLEQGTAPEVIEMFTAFKGATGKTTPTPTPTPAPGADAAARAAAAIAAAKSPVPTSLSEIPASTSAHHDEAAAMLEMNPQALMQRFENLSPQEIEKRLARVL